MNSDEAEEQQRAAIAPLERVEREAWLDMFSAVPEASAAALEVTSERASNAAFIAVRQAPDSTLNRVFGLGIEAPITEADLDAAINWTRQHGRAPSPLQLAPAVLSEEIRGWLSAKGFAARGTGWSKFWRGLDQIEPHPLLTELDVHEVEQSRRSDFGAVVQHGFGAPPPLAPWISMLVGRPGWRHYLAYDGAVPIASGSLFIHDGWGWLGNDATLAPYRGRGAQSALLFRRVSEAIALGLAGLTAETAHPPEGQEALFISHRNFLRVGFELAYVRPNYCPIT